MTLLLPLAEGNEIPNAPSFLKTTPNPNGQISRVIKSILKAKRIVIICGAGISVEAGIPDFRSSEGLFKTLKRDNPREALSSGKDLFDASVFNSEQSTVLFCQMISQLWTLSQAAEPTAFHTLLRSLDDRGKLLRVYTQNIDAIEEKCGLSFGIPEFEPRCKGRTRFSKLTNELPCSSKESTPDTSRLGGDYPRCIPLHGTLQLLHCQTCNHSYPLREYLPSLSAGLPPQCPECASTEKTRQMVGKRSRGIGKLRPSVVLYNEDHKDGEGVGGVVQKDLLGSSKGKGRSGADLLLVVGTSLRVPGTKRMAREFSKAVRSRSSGGTSASSTSSGTPNSTPPPQRVSPADDEPPMKSIYLNLDFPVPTREWEGVFDAWIQGDAQVFARMLRDEIEKENKAKEAATERKRKREEELSSHSEREAAPKASTTKTVKTPSPKKRKSTLPPTPPQTPPSLHAQPASKLMIRFPPKHSPHTSESSVSPFRPPSLTPSKPTNRTSSSLSSTLITPCKSPTNQFNMRTKAGRRAARLARAERSQVRKVEAQSGLIPHNDGSSLSNSDTPLSDIEEDVDVEELPRFQDLHLSSIPPHPPHRTVDYIASRPPS